MQRNTHWLRLDICDYTGKPLCNLYDSDKDVSGQATKVFTHSKRNGFKELSFELPSKCNTENGEERNYRLDYLINDYKIKTQRSLANNDEIEVDWFIVSERTVNHQAFSENIEVKVRHVSSLLNIKKLDLEFSEDEGNNVGTIDELAETILEGTGWHLGEVTQFYEEEKYGQPERTLKIRSFTASVQTGAFKMMSDLCELFDAKPIYHGEGSYEAYNVIGVNSDDEQEIYRKNCDIYEATKAVEYALIDGLTDVIIEPIGMLKGKTVDILAMNPFSEDYEEGKIPKNVVKDKVIELYYNKNIKGIKKTENTENLVTKLSAYGSYGDRNGLCSLQKASHIVLKFPDVDENTEYKFVYNSASYYFTATKDASNLKWSSLDFVSRSYVYNGEDLFEVYRNPKTVNYITLELEAEEALNYLPFVMDFSYYREKGLLTDDMLKSLASFQSEIPNKYYEAEQASYNLSQVKSELIKTASVSNGFLRIDVEHSEINTSSESICQNQLLLVFDKSRFPNGIIYRSDYDETKRNYFSWNVASSIKQKGQAVAGIGSVIYIVKQREGQQTSWTKSYVKMIGNEDGMYFSDILGNYYVLKNKKSYNSSEIGEINVAYVDDDSGKMYVWNQNKYIEISPCNYVYGLNYFSEPDRVLLWSSDNAWESDDIVYMFSSDSVAGMFGPREDAISSNRESIEKATQVSTEKHPIYFISENTELPSVSSAILSYGWCYRSYNELYDLGDLYFCWGKAGNLNWSTTYDYEADQNIAGDIAWMPVYISKGNENPEVNPDIIPNNNTNYKYYYHVKKQMLYRLKDEKWCPLNMQLTDCVNVKNAFKSVLNGCINQEILTKGFKEQYYHDVTSNEVVNGRLPVGNYAFKNEFNTYWLFTTDKELYPSDRIRYYPENKIVWQDNDEHNVLHSIENTFDILDFPSSNELFDVTFLQRGYNVNNPSELTDGNLWISNNVYIHENTVYECNLPAGFTIQFFTSSANYIGNATTNVFTSPANTSYIRVVCVDEIEPEHYLRVQGYDSCFFTQNKQYKILSVKSTGERTGIYYLMDKFVELSNRTYLEELPKLRLAQDQINQANLNLADILGDMYREGYWQKNDYVEGDEYKLYVDTLDNLKEISHPEATYEISYIELYGAEKNVGLSVIPETEEVDYPDVDISFAAHLVDPDIGVNCWAYLDSVDWCYDMPKLTEIEINTKLSMMGQQSFTDVLSHIAEVSNETRANQTIYKRAIGLSANGSLEGTKLEGSLETGKVYLLGGASNWHTDEKGNFILEYPDNGSAIMIGGKGILISQEKDQYGDWMWHSAISGKGIDGDSIVSMSISVDKVSSDFGTGLDIANNKSIMMLSNKIDLLSTTKAFDYITEQDVNEICI